ncbi:transcription regulator protein BACH1b isoform X1 [Echeneis naucrates]|uniref:transcription regulator protein BACH1b isoform X1 n=1 Tax=Echeneis naucrates TaxID=173247 RepID=UPI0011136E5E|nr:transcription regulator protein BACH1-like isoform X1 [Echeneis naucrates]
MSLMAMSSPRSSVFTFESTVHSSHVLRCLDDQRRRDMLCDVTVVVEGQSFRAHRSVLASCSEYFSQRISPLTQHGAVITLPEEVTAAGFEPLLKFAYTSKLLFVKDDVLEIRNSASVLGFRDLDEACFDFLLPKFLSSSKDSNSFPRKTCCKKKCKSHRSRKDSSIDSDDMLLDEKEVKLVADSPSEEEVALLVKKSVNSKMGSQNCTGMFTPAAEGSRDTFMQCPKYRKFQLACGKESCATEKNQSNVATVIKNDPNSPLRTTAQTDPTRQSRGEADELQKTEIYDIKTEDGLSRGEGHMVEKDTNERRGKWDENEKETGVMKMEDTAAVSSLFGSNAKALSMGQSTAQGEKSPRLILHHCPLRAQAEGAAVKSLERERFDMDVKEVKKPKDSGTLDAVSIHPKAEGLAEAEGRSSNNTRKERGRGEQKGIMENMTLPLSNVREGSTVEREVAEHQAKLPGPDVGPSQLNFQDPDARRSCDKGSGLMQPSLEWLKLHVNLSSSSTSCPFFQDLDQSKCLWKGAGLSECEGTSQSGLSSINSGEDGDSETETEGDSESYTRERAIEVQLPYPVDWIVDLSRNDFQQLLKQQAFTPEQLEFVHDMRRRSKNRLAAQRCRKRKLDCIYNLQCEINKLKTEREKLMMEKFQLNQLKLNTRHTVTALCQRVSNEANLQPEQLQVLAKYSSPDCPLSSFFPHIDALLSQPELSVRPPASRSACPVGADEYSASEEASSNSTDTCTENGQPSL